MDIDLPGATGIDALHGLRAMDEVRTTPVIAISAASMQKDISGTLNGGSDSYLTKRADLAKARNLVDDV